MLDLTLTEQAIKPLFSAHWRRITKKQPNQPWCHAWLGDRASLTQRLRSVCRTEFRLQRYPQQWLQPCESSCLAFLQLQPGERLLRRDVLLCDGNRPLVFACSLLPEAALQGRYEALRDLGDTPLGHWLFAEPALQRRWFHYRALTPPSCLLPKAINTDWPQDVPLWGRRTRFIGAARPLLVSEFFLPALQDYPVPTDAPVID